MQSQTEVDKRCKAALHINVKIISTKFIGPSTISRSTFNVHLFMPIQVFDGNKIPMPKFGNQQLPFVNSSSLADVFQRDETTSEVNMEMEKEKPHVN